MHTHTHTHTNTNTLSHTQTYPKGGEANGYYDETDGVHDEGHSVVVVSLQTNVRGQYLIEEMLDIDCYALSI